jgi:hypothetical protein
MPSLINRFLATGREVLDVERRLRELPPRHPDREQLGTEHTRLTRRQQAEIVTAVQSGASWDTVTFALALHGQGADRDLYEGRPTPAEELDALMRAYGGEAVIHALDAYRSILAAHAAADLFTARDHQEDASMTTPDPYAEGRADQAAGTVDTTRTADREYVAGLADQRTAAVDRELPALANPSTTEH